MEGKNAKCKRRRNIRLLNFIFICILYMFLKTMLSATPSLKTSMEYRCENINDKNILFLTFKIEGIAFSKLDILWQEHSGILKLKEKKRYTNFSNTILDVQYEICKIGKIVLDNLFLIIDDIKIKQEAIYLELMPQDIKNISQFSIRIFECNDNLIELKNEEPLILGEKYLLIIEGFFKKDKTTKINITPLYKDNVLIEQNQKSHGYLALDGALYSCFFYPLNSGIQNFGHFTIILEKGNEKREFILKTNNFNILKKEKIDVEQNMNKLQMQLEQSLAL